MKWRRAFDLFMVFIAGPLGLPYILFMSAISPDQLAKKKNHSSKPRLSGWRGFAACASS